MAYTRVNWENLPSTNTPVNATNLNKMDAGIKTLDTGKLDKAMTVTTANTNLNDYKSDGEWYFGVDYTPTNIPAGVNGWLKVMTGNQQGDNIAKQIWYRHGTPNGNDYETYVRTFSGNTWSSWRRLITEKNQVAYLDWNSVVLTRSDNNSLYIMLYGSNHLKEGNYSIANNFKLVTYGSTNSELTIPKSALSSISRRDWGFELVFNRSGISGIASGQYNGVAVPYDGPLLLQST